MSRQSGPVTHHVAQRNPVIHLIIVKFQIRQIVPTGLSISSSPFAASSPIREAVNALVQEPIAKSGIGCDRYFVLPGYGNQIPSHRHFVFFNNGYCKSGPFPNRKDTCECSIQCLRNVYL